MDEEYEDEEDSDAYGHGNYKHANVGEGGCQVLDTHNSTSNHEANTDRRQPEENN